MGKCETTPVSRVCTTCKEEKPLSLFYAHPQGLYGTRSKCKACQTARNKAWQKANPEAVREIHRQAKRRSRKTEVGRAAHYEANKRYVERNRESVNSYYRDRRENNPEFKASCLMRSMLRRVLARANKRKDAVCTKILGYNREQLRERIESQFTDGMTWDKVGQLIHIDHIVPVKWFFDNGISDPSVINALDNLQPLWAKANMTKGAKIQRP